MQPLEPQVRAVVCQQGRSRCLPLPTSWWILSSDRTMKTDIGALVVFTNEASPSLSFEAFEQTEHGPRRTPSMIRSLLNRSASGRGMTATTGCSFRRADDLYGSVIGETNAATVEVNATPPDNPDFIVASSNATSITLTPGAGYTPPSDLYGFRFYRSSGSFTSVDGLGPVGFAGATRCRRND